MFIFHTRGDFKNTAVYCNSLFLFYTILFEKASQNQLKNICATNYRTVLFCPCYPLGARLNTIPLPHSGSRQQILKSLCCEHRKGNLPYITYVTRKVFQPYLQGTQYTLKFILNISLVLKGFGSDIWQENHIFWKKINHIIK